VRLASGLGAAAEGPRLCPAVTRVIVAGIPAVAGVPVLEEDVRAAQNETRPPMYEMGGLARPRHAEPGQLPGFAGAAHAPPVPSTRARSRSPGSWNVPGVAPKVVPVSDGESISTASANATQELDVNNLLFFCYPHGIHRKNAVIRA